MCHLCQMPRFHVGNREECLHTEGRRERNSGQTNEEELGVFALQAQLQGAFPRARPIR